MCALIILAAASALQAGIIVDQQQLSGPNYMARFDQTDLAQSFPQTSSNIAGAANTGCRKRLEVPIRRA